MQKEKSVSSRRRFLRATGLLAGGATLAPTLMAQSNNISTQSVFGEYKKIKIGTMSTLKKAGEIDFFYPDNNSMCKAVYVNETAKAYSVVCTHKGCPTVYDSKNAVFECPCHFTKYDAKKDGQMIIGHATGALPEVILEIDKDDIYAVGFEGLIFGRINNTRG